MTGISHALSRDGELVDSRAEADACERSAEAAIDVANAMRSEGVAKLRDSDVMVVAR